MAMIKCPECGRDVSDRAGTCPQCGFYKDAVFDTNEKGSIRHANPENTLKSRAFTVPPVIPAEL